MQHLINKIHHANCFDVLAQIPDNSIDLVLTDPPYLTTKLEYDVLAAKTLDLNKWFAEIIRVAKPTAPILIFSSGKFTYKMVNIGWQYFRYELIWDKVNKVTGALDSNSRPLLNHEFVLYFSKNFVRGSNKSNLERNVYNHEVLVSKTDIKKNRGLSLYGKHNGFEYKKLNDKKYPKSILRYNKPNIKWVHPSEKPFGLIERLICLYSHPNSIVVDTFSGSGVVAHACILNDRNFIATELDAKFHADSIKRLSNCMFASQVIANNEFDSLEPSCTDFIVDESLNNQPNANNSSTLPILDAVRPEFKPTHNLKANYCETSNHL
ncbi:MAG: site-specific DNA-methyltransferase [Bacteroidia bacterium]|nr:MAG: site-specific DNA-methyltransferase [Bacteroidia bacterium]